MFQVVNNTDRSFSFYGAGPNHPHYQARVRANGAWEKCTPGWCGMGAGFHTVAPRSSLEFAVFDSWMSSGGETLQVGIHFLRGEAAELLEPNPIVLVLWRMREWLKADNGEPEPTWSKGVQISR